MYLYRLIFRFKLFTLIKIFTISTWTPILSYGLREYVLNAIQYECYSVAHFEIKEKSE